MPNFAMNSSWVARRLTRRGEACHPGLDRLIQAQKVQMAQINMIATPVPTTRSHSWCDGISGRDAPSLSKSVAFIGDSPVCL
jgi:hypothetical protein